MLPVGYLSSYLIVLSYQCADSPFFQEILLLLSNYDTYNVCMALNRVVSGDPLTSHHGNHWMANIVLLTFLWYFCCVLELCLWMHYQN